MKIKRDSIVLSIVLWFLTQANYGMGQSMTPTTGPVFEDIGPVFSIDKLDYIPESSQQLKAIFDVDREQADPGDSNPIISSLHRFYNMHARYGVPAENIRLAFVLHGHSTKDALSNSKYKETYQVDNPNIKLIKTLSDMGVDMFICGQSMSYHGYTKEDLLPEIKVALSAMTVLTTFQMDGYGMIKF